MVENNCITVSGVSVTQGAGPATVETVDVDIKLTQGAAAVDNVWTLSINKQVHGAPNPDKLHFAFTQSDMGQILQQFNNIWSNQPS
jgi:hypothetical protein